MVLSNLTNRRSSKVGFEKGQNEDTEAGIRQSEQSESEYSISRLGIGRQNLTDD